MLELDARKAIDALEPSNEDEKIGFSIVREALFEPFKTLVSNCGANPERVLDTIPRQEGDTVRTRRIFDGLTKHPRIGYEADILDATLVLTEALRNATSTAVVLLNTKASLTYTHPK